jgi:MFS family permease
MNNVTPSEGITSDDTKRSTRSYAMYVFYVLFAVSLLNNLDRSVFTSAANVIAKELHLDIGSIGYLTTAFTLCLTLTALPLGVVADRMKRKNVIGCCLVVWSLATAFTSLAGNFVTLFLARMVVGIGEAGYSPAGHAMLGSSFESARRTRVMTWYSLGGLCGAILGVILGGVVAGLFYGAWRLAFLLTGLPGLLLAVAVWRLREHSPDLPKTGSSAHGLLGKEGRVHAVKQLLAPFWALLHIKTLVVLIVMQTLASFAINGFQAYLPTLLQQKDALGLSSAQAGIFVGIGLVLSGIPGALLGGYLSNKLERHYGGAQVLICGLSALLSAPLLVVALLVAVTTHSLFLFALPFVLMIVVFSMSTGPAIAALLDVTPTRLRASASALQSFIQYFLGAAFAPTLVASLARSFDPGGQHFLHALAGHDVVLALLLLVPVALLLGGLVGFVGSRWMQEERAAAEHADSVALEGTPPLSERDVRGARTTSPGKGVERYG